MSFSKNKDYNTPEYAYIVISVHLIYKFILFSNTITILSIAYVHKIQNTPDFRKEICIKTFRFYYLLITNMHIFKYANTITNIIEIY